MRAKQAGLAPLVNKARTLGELAYPPPKDPRTVVKRGDKLTLRILRIKPERGRIGLSIERVTVFDLLE